MGISKFAMTVSLLLMTVAASGQSPLEITGTATYRERMAPPPGATFEATLEDVSLADAKARAVATTRNDQPGNPPFQFKISYDPSRIIPNHTYAVRARITSEGKLLLTTDQSYQVLTNGHGSEIAMMILKHVADTAPGSGTATATSAQGETSSDEPLRETYWKLIELDGKPVTAAEQQREAHLIFRSQDSRISGSGGCNRLMGSYVVEGSSMHFRGVGSTMMACLHGMETEQAFVGALNKVESWKITGKHLELFGAGDVQLMKFEATALR